MFSYQRMIPILYVDDKRFRVRFNARAFIRTLLQEIHGEEDY